MKTRTQVVLGLIVAVALVGGGVAIMRSSSADAGRMTADVAPPPATQAGVAEATAAIANAPVAPQGEVPTRFTDLDGANASLEGAVVHQLTSSIYAAIRSDGTPCFMVQLASFGVDGMCLRTFEGRDIVTSPVVVREYDSSDAPFDMFISGIARANVASVSFELRDGRAVTTNVVRQVFSAHLENAQPGDVVAATITTRSGALKQLTPLSNYAPTTPHP